MVSYCSGWAVSWFLNHRQNFEVSILKDVELRSWVSWHQDERGWECWAASKCL
jgi:hypothetical protein